MPNLCLSQAHCSAFQRTPAHDASDPSLSTASSYAHLHEHGPRSENPGVGGSIPSQPTVLLSSLPIREFLPVRVCAQICARLGHTPAHSSAPRSHSEGISSGVVREPMQLRVRVAHRRRFRVHDLPPHDQGRSVMVVVLAFRGRERVRHLN